MALLQQQVSSYMKWENFQKMCECFHTPVNSAQYRDVPRTTRKGNFQTPQLNEDAFRLFLVDT